MTETQPDIAHPSHNPFDLPRPRRNNGVIVAIILSVLIHGIIGYYLWQARFKIKYQNYSDEKTEAQLIKPPPPPPPPPRASVVTNPDFAQRPSNEDMARYYPDRAQRMGANGRATFSCTVTANGKLVDCSITNEDPPDQGFGDATLKLTRIFKLRPMTRDGVPTNGGHFSYSIRWQVPKD